jgi:hypothetical protein
MPENLVESWLGWRFYLQKRAELLECVQSGPEVEPENLRLSLSAPLGEHSK